MHPKLSPSTIMLLTLPPVLWAGNAVVGRLVAPLPLFTAVLSAAFLGEMPHLHHALAFVLIVGGIWVSASRR